MRISLDPSIQPIIDAANQGPSARTLPLSEYRATNDQGMLETAGAPVSVGQVEQLTVTWAGSPIGASLYRPVGAPPVSPAIVFIHGGGFVIGSRFSHDALARVLANEARAVVISTDYRLAPEHRFPAGLDDCEAVIRWVLDHASDLGLREDRIAVAGDSAGGNLATAVAMRLRDRGRPVAAQLLLYPVTSGALDTASYRDFATGYGLTRDDMEWFWNQYVDRGSRLDPEASPLLAPDLRGMPPTILVAAEADVLRDEAEQYAVRLRSSGVDVFALRALGMPHAFLNFIGQSATAASTLRLLARELGDRLHR